MNVTVEVAKKKTDYNMHAWMLLDLMDEFFSDPKNQRECEEWKKAREAQNV